LPVVARKVFLRHGLPTWPEGTWMPDEIPSWVRLTGLLPPGRLGDAAWQKELDAINAAMAAARDAIALNREVAAQARDESLDVEIVDGRFDPPISLRVTGRIHHVFPLGTGEEAGLQLLRAFPTVSNKKGKLKPESDLHFGERVSIFLDWALLRLQTARTMRLDVPLAPVQVTLLTAGNERPWQAGLLRWDAGLLRADAAQRKTMLDDLQSRVAKLIRWWHEAQRRPHCYFARTSWKAVSSATRNIAASADSSAPESGEQASPRAIHEAWAGFQERGERDHGPGYNRLLAGDVTFEAGTKELRLLLEFARDLRDAISFDGEVQP